MRYQVLQQFKVKTSQGITELQTGQVITLLEDKADTLIKNGKVKAVHKIMTEKYKDFMKWLKSYPVSAIEIKQAMPEHYQALQDAIEVLDTCYYKEELQDFNENMEKVKSLYLQALHKVNSVKLTAQEG